MATRGRKSREIDYHEVRVLSSVFCSEEEIAERLGFTYTGLRKRKQRDKELVAALKRGRSDAIRSLRAHQFQAAKKGNATMLVWLGKQYLKQTDRPEREDSDNLIDFIFGPRREDMTQAERKRTERNLELVTEALRSRGVHVYKMPSDEECKKIMDRLNRERGIDLECLKMRDGEEAVSESQS